MAAKTKRNVSGSALLRRKQFMEGAAQPVEEPKSEDTPEVVTEKAANTSRSDAPEIATVPAAPESARQGTASPASSPEAGDAGEGLTKKQLLEYYLIAKKDEVAADTIYFPHELYEVFREVWFARKKSKRGFKKSHIIIEALLRHPDIVEELKRRERLK